MHLNNAFRLMVENRWGDDWEVAGIEQPFMLSIHEDLHLFLELLTLCCEKVIAILLLITKLVGISMIWILCN